MVRGVPLVPGNEPQECQSVYLNMRHLGFVRRRMRRLVLAIAGIVLFLAVAPLSVLLPRNHPMWFQTLLLVSFFRVLGVGLLLFGIFTFLAGRRHVPR